MVQTPAILTPGEALYFERIARHLGNYLRPGMRILDAGCGDGKIAYSLHKRGCQVLGVDLEAHPESWKKLQQDGLTFQTASAEALPFPDASFDAAWAKDALHHMQHPEQAIAELQRVVKPNGPVILVEANRWNPVFYVHLTLLGNHQHFTRRQFRRMLHAADPAFAYQIAESRVLPWNAAWVLKLLVWFEDFMEHAHVFDPWLTYQLGVLKGRGEIRPRRV